jgi:hypothetical protein
MNKIIIFLLFFTVLSFSIFSLDNDDPFMFIELNSGYAIGIDTDNAIPLELKLIYPYNRFGLTVELGALFSEEETGFHFFIGPTFFIINTPKIRFPVSLGFDFMHLKTVYYGIGGIASFNYSLTKNIYIGINAEINFYFNNRYEEIVRIDQKDASIGIDPITGNKIYPMDKDGNPIYYSYTPIKENRDHYGAYFHIKPTITIGFQF